MRIGRETRTARRLSFPAPSSKPVVVVRQSEVARLMRLTRWRAARAFSRSAETGRAVAAIIPRACAGASSRVRPRSRRPTTAAEAAPEVTGARKPGRQDTGRDAGSRGFGITRRRPHRAVRQSERPSDLANAHGCLGQCSRRRPTRSDLSGFSIVRVARYQAAARNSAAGANLRAVHLLIQRFAGFSTSS